MNKPLVGSGNRNRAEALYLLQGHEPRHRKYSDAGSSTDWERDHYPPTVDEAADPKWAESMQRIEAQHPENETRRDMEARFGPEGSKISDEEVEAFLGPLPKNEDLPNWLREAIPTEDGGLAAKERKPQEIDKVKVPYELKRHPWFYGAIYGLLRYHALRRNENGHPQTWVSVARLAEEAGCTPRYVDYILRELEKLGLISTESRSGQSNLYTLLLTDPGRISMAYYLREKKSAPFIEL